MNFTPRDTNFREKVTESFKRQNFMTLIDAQLSRVEPGYCEIHIPYRRDLTQQHGFFHAGIVGTIADNACGYASYALMDPGSSILTVEFKLNLLAPADGELLIAKAEVLKHGKTLTVCRADVWIRKGNSEKLCAASQSTLIELHDRKDY